MGPGGTDDMESNYSKLLIFNGKPETFMVWKERFTSYLLSKNIPLEVEDLPSEKLELIKSLLYREIIMHLDDETLQSIISLDTKDGFAIWEHLNYTYGKIKVTQILVLWREFLDIQMKTGESMTEFLNRLDVIIYKLQSADEVITGNLKIATLLKSLPGQYSSFVAAVQFQNLTFHDLKTKLLEKSIALDSDKCNAEEERQNVAAKANLRKFQKNSNHFQNSGQFEYKRKKYCENCGKCNHPTDKCFAPGGKMFKGKRNNLSGFVTLALKVEESTQDKVIFDSGCTSHILTSKAFFKTLDENTSNMVVTNGDFSEQKVTGVGSACIPLIDSKGEQLFLNLERALYVPEYHFNLISMSTMVEKGNSFEINSKQPQIRVGDQTVSLFHKNGLYFLKIWKNLCTEKALFSMKIWHERFGHADSNMISKLDAQESVNGLKLTQKHTEKCENCLENKITEAPVSKIPREKANKKFELVHSDICGPISESIYGQKYVISFIDDYSKHAHVYFMKARSEAIEKFKQFLSDIGKESVGTLRSDNGAEYKSKDFAKLCQDNKIKQQFSAPYSPHQNGVAERYWRTVFGMARSMLRRAKLPNKFWVRAVETAVYIRNRSLTSGSETKMTPYETIYARKPNVGYFKIFGCTAFIKKPKPTSKLETKGIMGIFCGYHLQSPSYVIFVPSKNKFVISRNVKFDEQRFDGIQSFEPKQSFDEIFPIPNFRPELNNQTDKNETEVVPEVEEEVFPLPVEGISEQLELNAESDSDSLETNLPYPIDERPQRQRRVPVYLQDYVCYDKEDVIHLNAALKASANVNDPATYQEAMNSELKEYWQSAMETEMSSLKEHGTWELVPMPKDKPVIKGKWVFVTKRDKNGCVVKHKARYVAKGFSQIYGENYSETFAPTVSYSSIRAMLAFAAKENLAIQQIDIKTAFLNSPIEEEVYVEQPEGFLISGRETYVCKLKRCLYGLKQASRAWNQHITAILLKLGFNQSEQDPCIFYHKEKQEYLMVWVDDIAIFAKTENDISKVIEMIKEHLDVDERGKLNWFLGMEIKHDDNGLVISQNRYISDLLLKWGMKDCKPVPDPIFATKFASDLPECNQNIYRQLIGSLLYVSITSRPDIAYAVNVLSQYTSKPLECHFIAAKRVLRYLKGTNQSLKYSKYSGSLRLLAFTDADWANNDENRRSTSGTVIKLHASDSPIVWKTAKQRTVALSSCESEYVAITQCIQELIFLQNLFRSIQVNCFPAMIYTDSQSAMALANNAVVSNRSKHIDIKFHFIRGFLNNKNGVLKYVKTSDNIADIFTKDLHGQKFKYLVQLLYGTKEFEIEWGC